eukprot:CAMPEP_0202700858 /NCGR_PEP_ID=MMETSP1385-20130828/14013_1 /ASSEMBLY_ACC=CAM_ASM_000861 /TAXON_ID=933848 /ORGANISM="Elphidium margaritaceum" /LENGTH=684 /DNA_ID=CAMNT_0049358143 /DNA_START=19 /DNA_END=2073 /DNA_ORIENTATION=-
MSVPQNNPYLDPSLMNAYGAFSPAQNTAKNANTSVRVTQARNAHSQQQQQHDDMPDMDVVGLPFGEDDVPLSYEELRALDEGTLLMMMDEETDGWCQYKFVSMEEMGFVVLNTQKETIFIPADNDDDLPPVFKASTTTAASNENENQLQQAQAQPSIDYTLKDFAYEKGADIFVYDDANNFIFYSIDEYDAATTKATLRDKSGAVNKIVLRQFKHESANSQSKRLAITKPVKSDNVASLTRTSANAVAAAVVDASSNFIPLSALSHGCWNWVQRTSSTRLQWISYKHTLIGTISAGSMHLYPVKLDYKTLMFISGMGLDFHWLDVEVDDDDEDEDDDDVAEAKKRETTRESVVDEHLKLFLGDSRMDSTLAQISKYSHYQFERHTIAEVVNDTQNGVQRLMQLEQRVVQNLDQQVCSITNDERGHLALIVGYMQKPVTTATSPTMYFFRLKKFASTVAAQETEQEVAVDLYRQSLVITMQPPPKQRQYSIQHTFDPSMFLRIVSDLIVRYETQLNMQHDIDLFGRNALLQMRNMMEQTRNKETVSNKLGKLTIFALIRLFDARKATSEFIKYVHAKIQNAFHSQTGSEIEWKFERQCDISVELKHIQASLKNEIEAIRRQENLFQAYIAEYNGKALGTVRWQNYDRIGLKVALDEILKEEDQIFENLKKIQTKLELNQAAIQKN